jgi:hypothetical protein
VRCNCQGKCEATVGVNESVARCLNAAR